MTKVDYKGFTEKSGEFKFIKTIKDKKMNKIVFEDEYGYKYCVYKKSLDDYFNGITKELNKIGKRNVFSRHNSKVLIEKTGEFKFLDFEFKGNYPFIHFLDEFGYKYCVQKSSIDGYYNGTQSKFLPFHKSNPYTIYNIKLWINKNDYEYHLVSKKYESSDKDLTLKCDIHGLFLANWNNIYSNKTGCPKCAKNDADYAKELFYRELKKNNHLILSDYKNSATLVLIKNPECTHSPKWITPTNYRIHGYYCSECKKDEYKNSIYKLLDKNGDILLSEYIDSENKVLIKFNPKECSHKAHFIKPSNYKIGRRCPECHYDSLSGENSMWWNFELTDEERLETRKYDEYKEWVRSVFERDDFTCQKCKKRGNGELNAHHIFNFSEHKDLRTDLDNGITLCKDCHQAFHKKFGWKNNDNIQMNIFLKEA